MKMIQTFAGLCIALTSTSALACSCFCDDEAISDTLSDSVLFWGYTTNAKLASEPFETSVSGRPATQWVISESRVVEDYGQDLPDLVTTRSAPEDGGSCGATPEVGVLQLIYARQRSDDTYTTSSCNCEPPLPLALDYLRDGKDGRTAPNLSCEGPRSSRNFEENRTCKAHRDEFKVHHEEYLSAIDKMRSSQP